MSNYVLGTMRVLHVDCDRGTGHRSVLDLVQAGNVISYPGRSFTEAEGVFWALYRNQLVDSANKPFVPDLIVIDTVTKLAEATRQDTVLDPKDKGASTIWSLGDKAVASQRDWGIAGDRIVRLLRNFIELPQPTIFICHDGEREDPMTGISKAAPDLQRQVLRNVIADADAIVRLRPSSLPLAMPNGTVLPVGTRQLLLRPTIDSAVGVRAVVPLPDYIVDPTLADFAAALGGWEYFPHNTVLSGPPKIGKTTLACGANRRVS